MNTPLLPERPAIHEAAGKGNLAEVEKLLAENPKLANSVDDDGRLPLHWAISSNHKAIVELLHSTKGFDPDAPDTRGWTPLMIAASIKDGEEIVKLLLTYGAMVNAQNQYKQTALHFAVSKQNIDVVKLLLSAPHKANTRIRDIRQQMPIHRAAAIGSSPLIRILLDNNSPIDPTDDYGQTPLHHAIAEGHGDAAVTLLKRGATTDRKDKEGKLAIELAPDRKVRLFVSNAAKAENIKITMPEGMKIDL